MKTFLVAAAAASLLAAPAFAQEAAANATVAAKPASVTAPTPKKTFAVGKRIPGNYVATDKYLIKNPEEAGLAKPGLDARWIKIDGAAYLVHARTDVILEVAAAK